MKRWTVTELKAAAEACGSHFFERGTMRFFNSRVHGPGYEHPDGKVYFITSEGLEDAVFGASRRYSVRAFDQRRCNHDTVGKFMEHWDLKDAREALRRALHAQRPLLGR